MPAAHDDLKALFDLANKLSAPVRQWNEMLVQNSAQLLRFQYGLLGDWLNFSLEQWSALASARDPAELLGRPAAIGASYIEMSMRRGEEFMQISADAQTRFAGWVDSIFDMDQLRR